MYAMELVYSKNKPERVNGMNILMYMWKAHNQEDIKAAFVRNGHSVDVIEWQLTNYEEDREFEDALKCRLSLNSIKYDMVFSVNYFPLVSDVCQHMNIRYVSWTCDSPISTLYHQSVHNECNYIFLFDKIDYIAFSEMGARVFYLPLAAAGERADKVINAAEEDDYWCDVSFVGSMYNKNSYDEIVDRLPDYTRGYFDALMKMQMEIYGEYYIDSMLTAEIMDELHKYFRLDKSERSQSELRHFFANSVLGFKMAQMERQSLLNHLSKYFKVDIFTDDKYAEFPLATNRGAVDYKTKSPLVFNRSKINLNFTIRNIRSGIPLRVWDIMAAGGFCITNFQMEMPLYFENGKDIVWFEDKKDLVDKVRYYLAHEEERKEIADRGCYKVRQMHNYDVRIQEIERILI